MVINTPANAADGYRPQVETTCWSVGFYDFMKNVLKHLLSLYMQNLNGKCNWPGSEVKMFQGLGWNHERVADCHWSIFCSRAWIHVLNENLKGKTGIISVQMTECQVSFVFTKASIPQYLKKHKLYLVHNAVVNNHSCSGLTVW